MVYSEYAIGKGLAALCRRLIRSLLSLNSRPKEPLRSSTSAVALFGCRKYSRRSYTFDRGHVGALALCLVNNLQYALHSLLQANADSNKRRLQLSKPYAYGN